MRQASSAHLSTFTDSRPVIIAGNIGRRKPARNILSRRSCERDESRSTVPTFWLRRTKQTFPLRLSSNPERALKVIQAGPNRAPELVAQVDANMPSDDYRMREVLRCIESEPAKTVQDLAVLVNLSCSRLSHLFKSQTGVSLNRFLSDMRLQRAAELLRSTETQIKEISYMVGYNQPSSFDRAFRSKFALSPADYRRRRRFELKNSRQS